MTEVTSESLRDYSELLALQAYFERTLAGHPASVGGRPTTTAEFFAELRNLSMLILRVAEPDDLADLPPPAIQAFSAYTDWRDTEGNHRELLAKGRASRLRYVTPTSAPLMAAITSTAARMLATPSAAEFSVALAPLIERARQCPTLPNVDRWLPLSSRIADAAGLRPAGGRRSANHRPRRSDGPTQPKGSVAGKDLQLVGLSEASLILGIEKQQLYAWHTREDGKIRIAEPIARLRCGPIWLRSQIEPKVAELYEQRTGNTDGEGMRRWARERSLRVARRQSIDPALAERLLVSHAASIQVGARTAESLGQEDTRTPARKLPELSGVFEASLILAVEPSRFALWLRQDEEKGRQSIARPVARLMCGPIWLRSQIDAKLAEMYRERTGLADEEGKMPWALDRSLRSARHRGIHPSEVERLLALGNDRHRNTQPRASASHELGWPAP